MRPAKAKEGKTFEGYRINVRHNTSFVPAYHSFSRILRDTPPRNPKIPPTTAVTISIATISFPIHIAKQENIVAQSIPVITCGLSFVIILLRASLFVAKMPLYSPYSAFYQISDVNLMALFYTPCFNRVEPQVLLIS